MLPPWKQGSAPAGNMPSLQLPSDKAEVAAASKRAHAPSPKTRAIRELSQRPTSDSSKASGSMSTAAKLAAIFPGASAAVVPFVKGSLSSASTTVSDCADDEVIAVGGDFETMICVRCHETTDWASSSAYGRDPFKRCCNICGTSYRSRLNTITKEKTASPTGTSQLESFWKKLNETEQLAWYITQKANHAKHSRRATTLAPTVAMEAEDEQKIRKGRRRVNCLTTFAVYSERGRMVGKSDLQISDDWKALVRNTEIDREEINVGGQMELALELFDRIEVYTDEAEEQTWRQKRHKAIDNSEELPTAIADQQAEFEAARRGGQLQVGHAIAHQPANWDDRVANHHVEAHEQPVSRESVGSVLGPNMARASTDQLMRSLQASEQSKDELADEMRTSAAAAGAQRAKEQEASAQKQTLVSQRALIAARGVAASMRLSITSKVDALELEHDTTASMIADSTMPSRDTDITDLKKALQTAKDDADRATAEFDVKIKDFDVPELADKALKAVKTALRLIVSRFVAENSIFKTNKFKIETSTKAITSHLKKVNKQNMKATMANADVGSSTDWSENPNATAVLGSNVTGRAVFDLEADVGGPDGSVYNLACAVKLPELRKWAERMAGSQYVKSQKTFLAGWLKKNPSHTSQEAPITVKLYHTELDEIVHKALNGKFCDLSQPEGLTTHKMLKESGWAKGFIRSIALSSGHSQTGIAAYGLGEIIFGLEGQSIRAYESMVTHGPREAGRSQEPGKLGGARSQGSWEETGKPGAREARRSQGSWEEPGKLGGARSPIGPP